MTGLLWLKTGLQDNKKYEAKVTIPMLLTLTQKQEYSDRRDKVYGLLGLAQSDFISPNDEAAISADYSLSTVEVYTMVLRHALTKRLGSSTSVIHLFWKAASTLAVPMTDPLFIKFYWGVLSCQIWHSHSVSLGKTRGRSCRYRRYWNTSWEVSMVVITFKKILWYRFRSGQSRTFVARSEDWN